MDMIEECRGKKMLKTLKKQGKKSGYVTSENSIKDINKIKPLEQKSHLKLQKRLGITDKGQVAKINKNRKTERQLERIVSLTKPGKRQN